jgi:predicted nucleic acid-binding protein
MEAPKCRFGRISAKTSGRAEQTFLRAVFDTNILIDLLSGTIEANNELGRYSQVAISRISWIEVLTGVRDDENQNRVESLLDFFEMIELDEAVSRQAIELRKQYRLKIRDAIVFASAKLHGSLLVTRDLNDFPAGDPGIRVPYEI